VKGKESPGRKGRVELAQGRNAATALAGERKRARGEGKETSDCI